MGYLYWLAMGALACVSAMAGTVIALAREGRIGRFQNIRVAEPEPVPERREPRDMSRLYPKRVIVGPDDERLTTCPVCGMEDPLFLDGGPTQASFFGWPAHATCVEWLGKWEPPSPPRPMPKYTYVGGQAIPAEPVYLGGTAVTVLPPTMMTVNELREGLACMQDAIVKSYATPEPDIIGGVTCDCGMCFYGSRADTGRSMYVHRSSGQHEQRMAYNQSHPGG
jgi:hypothetical protein